MGIKKEPDFAIKQSRELDYNLVLSVCKKNYMYMLWCCIML